MRRKFLVVSIIVFLFTTFVSENLNIRYASAFQLIDEKSFFASAKLKSSKDRENYPDLNDEEFANFRMINTTGIKEGVLFRSSSPVNPKKKRNVYADNAMKKVKATIVINLADTKKGVRKFKGYSESYYSTIKSIELNMSMNFQSSKFEAKLAKGLKFMAENPGIYVIHCKKGKDRTGFVAAILECLMGASYKEVVEDYMVSYYNLYGVTKDDPRYWTIVEENIEKSLRTAFELDDNNEKTDLSSMNLSKYAKKYLHKIGLKDKEIHALMKNLLD